jgi:Family of unknown function (DUF5994)
VSATDRRGSNNPIRLTLASDLGNYLDGAWWPYTASIARELPDLIEAVSTRLGDIVDLDVNWSSLQGAPDLNPMPFGGKVPLPGARIRQQRVITITGKQGRANLLVIPSRTTRALAVMVLRHAASLPIEYGHADTSACRTAEEVVRNARAECAQRALAGRTKTSAVDTKD